MPSSAELWTMRFAAAIPLAALALCAGCHGGTPHQPQPLVLLASGDTAGWIVPCGCAANQSGGLLRRGTLVADLRREAELVYVDVGGAPSGNSPYDLAKFEAILHGERQMAIAAHNLGTPELRLGADTLRELGHRLNVPWLSCNARDEAGKLIAEPVRLMTVAGRRVAIVGVVTERSGTAGWQIDPPREAILAALDGVRGHYDSAIVLAYLDQPELETLAAELPEVDAIVGGPTGQSVAPSHYGPTLLASATNKGKFVVRLDAPLGASARWSGQTLELTGQYADDTEQRANLAAFYRVLEKHDFTPDETTFVQPSAAAPRAYQVAGTHRCQECHADDCQTWEASGHAHAWKSLKTTGAHVDSYCQQCHTTGYGLPGGFVSARRSEPLTNVGCESCHGPSRGHVEDQFVRTAFSGQAAGQCARCHDRENSPQFAYDSYWPQIEHGSK